jgi:hypothetical protein
MYYLSPFAYVIIKVENDLKTSTFRKKSLKIPSNQKWYRMTDNDKKNKDR